MTINLMLLVGAFYVYQSLQKKSYLKSYLPSSLQKSLKNLQHPHAAL